MRLNVIKILLFKFQAVGVQEFLSRALLLTGILINNFLYEKSLSLIQNVLQDITVVVFSFVWLNFITLTFILHEKLCNISPQSG